MRNSTLKVALTFATLGALVTAAVAAPYYHPVFDPKRGGSICHARIYSDAFLKKNPNVKLKTISLERASSVADGKPNSRSLFAVKFGATTTAEDYTANAYCKPLGKTISCNVEADGGTFIIMKAGKGVVIKTRRIQLEGFYKDLSIASAKGKPTRSFTLFGHGKKTCAAVFD